MIGNAQNFMVFLAIIIVPLYILAFALFFGYRLKKYGYLGNVLIYIAGALILCFIMMMIVNYSPIDIEEEVKITLKIPVEGTNDTIEKTFTEIQETSNVPYNNGWERFVAAVGGAFRMMAVAYDKGVINPYFEDAWSVRFWFGIMFVATSIFAFASTSLSVILFLAKTGVAKIKNIWKSFFKDNEVYYIFSNAKVADAAIKLGQVLMAKKHIVIMYITKASLKTQEGTEYRDMLINAGFDVKSEGFSEKLCSYLFKKYFNRNYLKRWFLWSHYRDRKVTIYGLFPDDESSVELASNFRNGIIKNEVFQKHFGKYLELKSKYENERTYPSYDVMTKDLNAIKKYRVFITYQDYDIDLINDFSSQTLHIVNALSQYDMVSSEFILNNPLSDLIDINEEKEYKCLNVSFFGFGNINRPIYEKMTYACQASGDNKNKIHYHIYDYNADKIVEQLTNEYVIPNEPEKKVKVSKAKEESQEKVEKVDDAYFERPLLYGLDVGLTGKDLNSYEILKKHFEDIKKNNKGNRFKNDGFEMFVVSAAKTNQDIKIAFNLREVLLRTFSKDELNKAYIYVRIGDELIANNLVAVNEGKVFKQKDKHYLDKGVLLPIIIFGEDTNMAHFIKQDYDRLIANGRAAYASYNKNIDGWSDKREAFSWLLTNKTDVLTNTATAYSLKTKLNLLGYKLNKRGLVVGQDNIPVNSTDIESVFAINYLEANKNEPAMRLASLEHNRWMATVYNIFRYDRLDKKTYRERNEKKINEYKKKKKAFDSLDTKSAGKTSHICMTTNEEMKNLYNLSNEIMELLNDEKAAKDIAYKLVYENDVNSMSEIFDQLEKYNKTNLLFFDVEMLINREKVTTNEGKEQFNLSINKSALSYLAQIANETDSELIQLAPYKLKENEKIDAGVEEQLSDMLKKDGLEITYIMNNQSVDQFKELYTKNVKGTIDRTLVIDYKKKDKKEEKRTHLSLNERDGLTEKKLLKAIKWLNKPKKEKKNKKKQET